MNSSANTNEHQGDSNWSTENWDNTGAISSALEHASRQYTTNRLEWEWDPMILAQHPGSDGPNEVGDGDHKSQITAGSGIPFAGQMSSLRAYNNTISTGLPATFTQNALGIFNPAGMWNYGALDGSGVVLPPTGHLPNSLGSGIPGLAASSGGHHENIQTAFDGQHHNQYLPSGMHKNHLVKREDVSDGHTAPCIGLNLGVRTYFSAEDTAVGRVAKRHRAGSPGTQIPMCQAEGCKADLSTAKHYHRRHKVCELHSKTPTVIAAGRTQRFCQQCSRFHLLGEFDEGKRSCRRRLADHNRRRRKQQPSAVSTGGGNSAEITSIRHGDDGDNGGVVSDASYGRGGPGDNHQSLHQGMQLQTSSMAGQDSQAFLSAMSLSPPVPLLVQHGKQEMSMMTGSSNHAQETAAYRKFLQGMSAGQSGPNLSLSSLGEQLGLGHQAGHQRQAAGTGSYGKIEPGVPWMHPLNSCSDLVQVVDRSSMNLHHLQTSHHSANSASSTSPNSQSQEVQVFTPTNRNMLPLQASSQGDKTSPEWMLGSQGNSSNHYGPSSAMSRSRHQLKGHQMLPLQNASTMRAGDGCSTSGGGNGCGSGTQDAGEHAPVMELLPHRIKPTAESSSPDNNNNNNNNDQNKSNHSGNHTRAGVQSPELNYSELQTLRSYGAGPSIYDLHHNLM